MVMDLEPSEKFFIFGREFIAVALQNDFRELSIAACRAIFAGAPGIGSYVAGGVGDIVIVDPVKRQTLRNNTPLTARSYAQTQKGIRIKRR